MSRGNTYSLPRDANRVPVVAGVSTADGITPVPLEVDPITGLLQTNAQVNNTLTVNTDAATDMFGAAITAPRYNQIEIDYSTVDPDAITDITVTKTNGGDASNSNGQAQFTTGANTSGGVKAVTNLSITYRPMAETYASFSAIFATGLANSYQRIGIYDATNGLFIGYEGTSFGVTYRSNSVDTRYAQASFNVDTLTGAANSKFTRNGTPEALNPQKDNLFRIRYGWLGASNLYYEVLSPDQTWVLFHIVYQANNNTTPSLTNPNLPMTIDVQKSTAGATVLTMGTACWAAGSTSNFGKVTDTITDNTLTGLNRSVIVGKTSGGGGGYVNVKVTPSGSLTTAIGDISGIVGQQTMANSIPVVIASNQNLIATSANQTTANGYLQALSALTPSVYDYISLSYTGTNLTGVVFKTGGSGGTTVSTLTLAYTGSTLTSVTKT